MRRPFVAGALALAALALGSCGIPLSQSAQPVSSRSLPPLLSGATPSSTTTTTSIPPAATQHQSHLVIYLVDPSGARIHLVAVRRYWQQHVTPLVALGLLAQGPNSVDSHRGLQTQLGSAAHFDVSVAKATGVAKVTLDEATFANLFGASLYIPLAQIVYTLMANFSYVKGVEFFLGGELFNYTPSGTLVAKPVTEQTYANAIGPLPSTK